MKAYQLLGEWPVVNKTLAFDHGTGASRAGPKGYFEVHLAIAIEDEHDAEKLAEHLAHENHGSHKKDAYELLLDLAQKAGGANGRAKKVLQAAFDQLP